MRIDSAVAAQEEHVSLCETLDRVLNKGVFLTGDLVISVAEVDLIYLGLKLMLSSAESSHSWGRPPGDAPRDSGG